MLSCTKITHLHVVGKILKKNSSTFKLWIWFGSCVTGQFTFILFYIILYVFWYLHSKLALDLEKAWTFCFLFKKKYFEYFYVHSINLKKTKQVQCWNNLRIPNRFPIINFIALRSFYYFAIKSFMEKRRKDIVAILFLMDVIELVGFGGKIITNSIIIFYQSEFWRNDGESYDTMDGEKQWNRWWTLTF